MLNWILGILGSLVSLYILALKSKVAKATREKDKALGNLAAEKDKAAVFQQADKIKDNLATSKESLGKEKEAEIKAVLQVKKEEALSDETKRLAADQSRRADDRARAYARRVQDSSK